jgi:predicted Fe-Mo cluster-binding NifX family protein
MTDPGTKTTGGAISADRDMAVPHFNCCAACSIADVENGDATRQNSVPSPGHEPGFLSGHLAERGWDYIAAGGMWPRARGLFIERRVQTAGGMSGSIADALDARAKGKLGGRREDTRPSAASVAAPGDAGI